MDNRVAHFVRKFLPPAVSFIRNQIISHVKYSPLIVYKESVDSDLAEEITLKYESLFLEENKNGLELEFSKFLYNKFRIITKGDVQKILRFLDAKKAKILHFHYGTDARMYLEIIKSSEVPSVVSFYGYDCSSFPRRLFGYGRRFLSQVFRNIDYAFAMSDDMRDDLILLGCPEDKVIVHYYGTDVKNFSYDRKYEDKECLTLLIVSSLDEKKGHKYIMRALQRLEPLIRSRVHLKIVGSGPLEGELRKCSVQLGVSKAMTFVGPLKYLSKAFLQEFYNADIFLHPSVIALNGDKEGIPGAIIEAMATGLPVIATYHAGIPHIIRHGDTGFLIKEKDVGVLADHISRLVLDPDLRKEVGQRAQQHAQERLDLKEKEIELESIYDFVINNSNRKSTS